MTGPVERDFPNIERLLAAVFADVLGGTEHVGNQTPPNLEAVLPFARAARTGGPRTATVDYPTVEVDVFAVDEATATPIASGLANLLLGKPPPHPSIDLVICEPSFRELPWGANEDVYRLSATFFIETRMVRVVPL